MPSARNRHKTAFLNFTKDILVYRIISELETNEPPLCEIFWQKSAETNKIVKETDKRDINSFTNYHGARLHQCELCIPTKHYCLIWTKDI